MRDLLEQINAEEVVSNLIENLILFAPKLITAIFVFVLFYVVWRVFLRIMRRTMTTVGVEPRLAKFLVGIGRAVVLGFALVMAADQVGVSVMSLVAGLGVAGLALSLAAQSTVANIIAGITLLWDRPFVIGDDIRVGDVEGDVIQMTFRSVRVLTDDHRVVTLPNTQLVDQNVINNTQRGLLRLRIPGSIAYKEDTEAARKAILDYHRNDERIVTDPPPKVVITGLGDSGVKFEFRPWLVDPQMERDLEVEYPETVKKALNAAGIEIPFPHLKIFYNPEKSAQEW
jgi:small conductance mechanosensitive channel